MHPSLQPLLSRLEQLSEQFRELRDGVQKAIGIADQDPEMALTRARKVLEYVVRDVYERRLKEPPGTRPLDTGDNALISPVDGAVSQIGRLDGSQLLQAKGHNYSLEALLNCAGAETNWAPRFANGCFATLYLAPFNYHRIHMPLSGTLRAAWYVPGALFSVNAVTAGAVAGLFTRNERVVCIFEDGPRLFAMVLVGALFVGSMDTVWHGEITPRTPRTRLELPLDESRARLRLEKGAEMGRFNMGSTVILILPPDTIDWLPDVRAGDRIRMGQSLARLRKHG